MSNYEICFTMDGKAVTQEQIREVELKRCKFVLHDMIKLGVTPTYKGVTVKDEEIEKMEIEKAKETLSETKAKLGADGIRSVYRDRIISSNQMWREISQNSPAYQDLQPSITEVEVKGITMQEFAQFNLYMEKKGTLLFAHPDHFTFQSIEGGQIIMETMGMYGEPTYCKLIITNEGYKPITPDPDTKMVMFAAGYLMSDGTDMKVVGMHQFKPTPDGLKIKMGIFFPKTTPKEIIEGHKMHLAIEFNNVLHFIGDTDLNK